MKTHVGNVEFSLRVDLEAALKHIDDRVPLPAFIHLFHPDAMRSIDTLSRVAWNSPRTKEFLVELTNRGYSAYLTSSGESRLVHRSRLNDVWVPLRDGVYSETAEGQIFEYFEPVSGRPPEKLLVIFSSVYDPALTSDLSRYFNRTFLSIQNFLPHNIGVLRVADVGGVLGAFYMNTRFRPDNESLVLQFLHDFISSAGLRLGDVVLYGASKGGTASLAYGLRGGFKFVSVDPIVDDTYYHQEHKDLHFTNTDIFLQRKTDMFGEIFRNFLSSRDTGDRRVGDLVSRSVICSEGSPLYPYLEKSAISALRDHVSFFKARNPKIDTHPGVAQNTINALTMILNDYFYDREFEPGVLAIY